MISEPVAHFSSDSEAYRDSFDTFLRSTDQKIKAREWLDRMVDRLPRHEVFIDAGAGEGTTTAWMAERFQRTLAIEPNESLRERLALSCPGTRTLPQTILEAQPEVKGDFVLCSHVFYYLDDEAWDENLDRLTSWLTPGGILVLIMQNPTSDCMQMLRTFFGRRDGLDDLMRRFQKSAPSHFSAWIDTVPCHINAPDLETAYKVAEFLVSTRPDGCRLERAALESYVASKFRLPNGNYRFSCTQDFLVIGNKLNQFPIRKQA
jgi:SAM-dependent methyltransferase